MTPNAAEPVAPPADRPPPGPGYYLRRGLKTLASLQLTVVLFALSIGLIFFGTVAQMDYGIWTVVDRYFWSWAVWVLGIGLAVAVAAGSDSGARLLTAGLFALLVPWLVVFGRRLA